MFAIMLLAASENELNTRLPRITRGIISICTLQTGDLFLASGSEPTINVACKAGHDLNCYTPFTGLC